MAHCRVRTVLLLAEQVHLDRPLEVSVTEQLLQWHLVRIVERKKVAFMDLSWFGVDSSTCEERRDGYNS